MIIPILIKPLAVPFDFISSKYEVKQKIEELKASSTTQNTPHRYSTHFLSMDIHAVLCLAASQSVTPREGMNLYGRQITSLFLGKNVFANHFFRICD
jgi:hypothetical protein